MSSQYTGFLKSSPQTNGKSEGYNEGLLGKRQSNGCRNGIRDCYAKKARNNFNKGSANTMAFSSHDAIMKQRKTLPVYACRNSILKEMRMTETLLMMGETGTGKTTQIPQFLLSDGYGRVGIIGITQPRRVAAITIANRVAREYGCTLGDIVGYTVRFEDCTSAKTRIRFITDGSLLREALSDRLLLNYSVLMLDEAHERTLNNDVLFGIVKEAQRQRKLRNLTSLKLIITSATMDIDHFSKYFGVRGMYLEGRTHPVKVMHVKNPQSDYLNAVLVTLFDIHINAPANENVLVFLTGQEEIECMAHQIRQIVKTNTIGGPGVRVFPLYSQLPQTKQFDCFLPMNPNLRKIVLATNIAETSITIPGIKFVIDCGYVKQRTYSPENNLDVLKVVRISQAQSWQRCGRAGREMAGICYRTYTKDEMEQFEMMPKPEILRSNVAATVLQLLAMEIDYKTFDFIDQPRDEAFDAAFKKLISLGAIKSAKSVVLTTLGRQMTQFPLDPQYSKLLMSASGFGCMEEMLSLVAIMSGENVFVSSRENNESAALAHAKFESKHGDHLTLLNVFNSFRKADKVKQWCHENFLNLRNLLYAQEVRKQLVEITERLQLNVNTCGKNYDAVRKCLIAGLFDNLAELQRDNFYVTISGRQRTKIHPSSVFHGKYRPSFVLFSKIIQTDRIFLRDITEIEADWIVEVVPNFAQLHRVKSRVGIKTS